MKRLIPFKLGISLAFILLLGTSVWADVETADIESGYFKHEFELGYRVFNDKDNALRAREYDFNHSNTTGSAEISVVEDWGHLNLDGSYLNEKDFDAAAHIEAGSILRLDLNTTSLFHNLDHINYENRPDAWEWSDTTQPPPPLQTPPDLVTDPQRPTVQFSDSDPTAIYGIKTQISEAKARLKMGNYPAHLNLNYWSLERSGQRQQRYLAENCSGCHVQSTSRPVDQIVEEFKASIDAHVGPVDVIVEQTFRQFDNRNPAPVDVFGDHFRQRQEGNYEHDDEPDQRYRATTLKLHTSLAGGLIAGASGTIGKRENESDVQDVTPIEAETDIIKAAGDLSWTPSGHITLNTRYRYLDIEYDTVDTVFADGNLSPFAPPTAPLPPISVRKSIDQTVHNAVAALSWRPIKRWQVKAEGNWREIDREIADPQTGTDLWDVPEDETRTRYKLALYGRALDNQALRLRSWLQYSDSNDPAYGASFDERKTAFVGLDYSPSTRWGIGLNAKYEVSEQENHLTVIEEGTPGELRFERDREQDSAIITAMAWNRPTKSLEIGLHYGYLDTRVTQDVIFGTDTGGVPDFVVPAYDADYDQSVHNANIQFNWRCRKAWTTRAEGRLILSRSEFDPDFADELLNFDSGAFPATATATGLSEISKIDIRQYGASAGIDWEPTDTVRCGLTYTWDKYDDRQKETLDGTVQTYMASLSKAW